MTAVADFNKELGNSGPQMTGLKKQMVSTGVQFELLGKSFAEGAQAVTGLAAGMMTVRFTDEQLKTGLILSEYVGLGAEQAGKLMLAFDKEVRSIVYLSALKILYPLLLTGLLLVCKYLKKNIHC